MFDFKSIDAPKKLNRDFILSKLTDAQIFYYYFGKFDLKSIYPSKFHKDRNPSSGFYISTSGKIIYNHLNGKEPKMDCFAFVCRLYNCSFSDAIKRIALDFGLISGNPTPMADKVLKEIANFDRSYKKDTRIHFVPQPFDEDAKAFWKSFHATRDELKREGVYQIKKLYINDIFIPNHTNSLRFALTVPFKDELKTKVYSPGGTDTLKWVSNIPLDMPFGFNTLKKQGGCSITAKAVKDLIVLKKFIPSVIASQNESRAAMSDSTINKLKFYFHDNYVGWDNDETGLEAMEEMATFGFKPVHVPIELLKEGIKDFSDLAKEKGLKAVEKLLKQKGII
jgi:hypothetical protein